MHPLDGPKLKVTTADRDAGALQATVAETLADTNVYAVCVDTDRVSREKLLKVKIMNPPDRVWGIRIGGIAHLYRSALDNLVYQLALLNTATPYEKITFPIYQSAAEFHDRAKPRLTKNGKIKGVLQDLSPEHRALIESFQPYHRGDRAPYDALALLHEMNNVDKHRVVHVAAFGTQRATIEFDWIPGMPDPGDIVLDLVGPYEHGTIIATYPPDVEVLPTFKFAIRFDRSSGVLAKRNVFTTFGHISRRVNQILDSFSDEFPTGAVDSGGANVTTP